MRATWSMLLLAAALASCSPPPSARAVDDGTAGLLGPANVRSVTLGNEGASPGVTGACAISPEGRAEILVNNPNGQPTYCVASCLYGYERGGIGSLEVGGQQSEPVPAQAIEHPLRRSDVASRVGRIYAKGTSISCSQSQATITRPAMLRPSR